mgnify:CR=1 FL=1
MIALTLVASTLSLALSVWTIARIGEVEAFVAAHPDFTLLPVSKVWAEIAATPAPSEDPYLQLSPARHGTDGFFAAVLERAA